MTQVSQLTLPKEEQIYYPAPGADLAAIAIDSSHSYAARQILLESISQLDHGLAKELAVLEVTVLNASNFSQTAEAIEKQLDKVTATIESLPCVSLEVVKFLDSLAEPIEELHAKADLIRISELSERIRNFDLSEFEEFDEWKDILRNVNSFALELLENKGAAVSPGGPQLPVPAPKEAASQSQHDRSGEQLDDLAVCTGAIGYTIKSHNEDHPSLLLLTELNQLIGRAQYRHMNIHVTRGLCEKLPELQELIVWLDEQEEIFTDVQNLKELRSAILSLSDFSLGRLRDIKFSEAVKGTEPVKVQEFLAPTSTNLAGVSLEDDIPEHIISISSKIQMIVLLELDKVRGVTR